MPTVIEELPKSELHLNKPFTLMIGRHKRLITEPATFVMRRWVAVEHGDAPFDRYSFPIPSKDKYELFINGRLYSTTFPTGTRRGSVVIRKASAKRDRLQIHLIKKYTNLAPS
ncbi:MAG TPA: hypothetical protein VIX17_11395 [Pyrinomonadaceae bacterium]